MKKYKKIDRNYVLENIPDIKKQNEYDIIVVGGGPAGIGAAIAARSLGAKTLLIEANSCMGGVASAAMWMPVNRIMMNGVTEEGGNRGGVHDLFVNSIKKYGAEAYSERRHPATDVRGGLSIHPEYLRLAIFDLLEDIGCHYRLYSPAIGVSKDGNALNGVIISTKTGVESIKAKVVIDCTGDGDVSYYAGVKMCIGREEDGLLMPPALLWTISNVNIDKFYNYYLSSSDEFKATIDEADREGFTTCNWYGFDEASLPGTINVNNGGVKGWGNINMTDELDMTVAERLGIQAAIDFCHIARAKKIPGLEDCHLARAGSRVAIRDTRRIVGEYIITHEDALEAPEFTDIVSRRYGFIDAVGYYIADMVSGHAYPYRCLVPLDIDNLLVAGRCASATHLGFASGRGMGECMGMGQAAGVAAVESIRQHVVPRKVDVRKVQEQLREIGVKL